METKINKLKKLLKSYESLIVGFSGGTDSTLLCYYSYKVLGEKFLAITAVSETLTPEEQTEATDIAKTFNWPHLIIRSNELDSKKFTTNTPDKCKWCKDIRFQEILKIAKEKGFKTVAAGDNLDDIKDYRPGFAHAKTMGIKSPLIEAGFNKSDIRQLSKELGLPNHNKPSNACLASRIPYGIPITKERLQMVEKAEKYIKELGYSPVRVRHHENMARIEINNNQLIKFVSFHSNQVTEELKEIGYAYVVLDLQGYRMGSLNEVIET